MKKAADIEFSPVTPVMMPRILKNIEAGLRCHYCNGDLSPRPGRRLFLGLAEAGEGQTFKIILCRPECIKGFRENPKSDKWLDYHRTDNAK